MSPRRPGVPRRLGAATGLLVAAASCQGGAAKPSTAGGSKACSHTGFYSKKVVALCERHFPDVTSKHAWVVQFYHPYVKKVRESSEAFEELAAIPEVSSGNLKVGGVDCRENGEFCAKHGIREAPTTRFMLRGQSREFESAEHTLDALKAFFKDSLKSVEEAEEALKCSVKGVFTDPGKDATIPLCTGKFPPSLDPLPWVVTFYESGDRNKDKTTRSVMNKLAEKFGNSPPKKKDKKGVPRLKVGAVECTDQSGCADIGVTTFPTVRFYDKGAEPQDFDSFFDREEIQKWANARLKAKAQSTPLEVLKADMPEGESAPSSAEGKGAAAEL